MLGKIYDELGDLTNAEKYLKLASGREFRGILVLNNGEILVLEG
jgi:hypothetical protein